LSTSPNATPPTGRIGHQRPWLPPQPPDHGLEIVKKYI
jgi:hypothetical protein